MTIADSFTALSAWRGFGGGVLIGLAAALVLLGMGRIAGVAGIAARASGIASSGMPRGSAVAFLVGLPAGAGAVAMAGLVDRPALPSLAMLIVAGLLVGFGTRLGNGCTSGHGVCGMSRLSARSIAATAAFIASGIATVAIMRMVGLAG